MANNKVPPYMQPPSKIKLLIPLSNHEIWEVEAMAVGDLALHKSRKDPNKNSVTHIPTLTRVDAVPKEISSQRHYFDWMRNVQHGMQKDWLAMRKVTPQEVRTDPLRTKFIRERLGAHCLETKI